VASRGGGPSSSFLRQFAIGLAAVGVIACTVIGGSVLTMQEGRQYVAAEPTETPTVAVVLPPTRTPTSTPTAVPSTPTPTWTPTEEPPTATAVPPSATAIPPTSTATPRPTSTRTSTATPQPTQTATPTVTALVTATQNPTETPVPMPTATRVCIVPSSWRLYTVQRGDTLSRLAVRYGTSVSAIVDANCLSSTSLYVGQRLYLPAQAVVTPIPPTATVPPAPTAPSCVPYPEPGWVLYTVQAGDNLYSLAQSRHTTVGQIQRANCLEGYGLTPGQQLYLPPAPPAPTPTWTNVPTATATWTPAWTPTMVPTSTPVPTPTWTPTATEVPPPKVTPTVNLRPEPTPTFTLIVIPGG
jgi:LysM repeat protein